MTPEPEHTCHDEETKALYEGEIYASTKGHRKISEYLHDLQAKAYADGYAAGRKAALPSREEIDKEAKNLIGLDSYASFVEGVNWLASRIIVLNRADITPKTSHTCNIEYGRPDPEGCPRCRADMEARKWGE